MAVRNHDTQATGYLTRRSTVPVRRRKRQHITTESLVSAGGTIPCSMRLKQKTRICVPWIRDRRERRRTFSSIESPRIIPTSECEKLPPVQSLRQRRPCQPKANRRRCHKGTAAVGALVIRKIGHSGSGPARQFGLQSETFPQWRIRMWLGSGPRWSSRPPSSWLLS
jgi:hypothetical protein